MEMIEPSPLLTVAEALQRWPQLAELFLDRRLACPGCAMAPFDTLRDVAAAYGIDLAGLLEEMDRAAAGGPRGQRRDGKETEMTPTETLKHEHQIIQLVLNGAEREAAAIRGGAPVDAEAVERMVDFFRNFVDRCHHGKEERYLFPALVAKGFSPEAGPVAVMLHEHEQGRAAVRAIAAALPGAREGDAPQRAALADALLAYVELLRGHIFKENNVLFPMADQVLPEVEQAGLAQRFEQVEAEEIGPGVHERYHALAHELGEV
jgi:hybrid cluster-associated redox disulfide protein